MRRILFASGVLLVFCFVLSVRNARAIPAFAKKYHTTCMTCHALFPQLSAFGEAFRLNGFQIPGGTEELYVKEKPVSMGAEAWKKMFPQSVWPSTIPEIPPISIIDTNDVLVDTTGTHKNSTEFDLNNDLHILAGGSMGEHIAFWAGAEFEVASPSTSDSTTVSSTEAFLMYKDLLPCYFGTNHLNLRGGYLGSFEISLPNLKFDNSFEANDFLYGDELSLGNQPGFEANGFGKWWQYHVGITKSDTSNSERDYYANVNFKIGGLGFDGSSGAAGAAGGLTAPPAGYWVDNSVSFGGFWYRSYDGPDAHAFDRFGGDVLWRCQNLALGGGFARGQGNDLILPAIFGASFPDTPTLDAFLNANHFPSAINENIWTVDAQYFVFPWMVPYARFELVDVTDASALNKNRIVIGVAMLVRANIRLNFEGRYYFKNEPFDFVGVDPSTIDANQVDFRFQWGF